MHFLLLSVMEHLRAYSSVGCPISRPNPGLQSKGSEDLFPYKLWDLSLFSKGFIGGGLYTVCFHVPGDPVSKEASRTLNPALCSQMGCGF